MTHVHGQFPMSSSKFNWESFKRLWGNPTLPTNVILVKVPDTFAVEPPIESGSDSEPSVPLQLASNYSVIKRG